MLLLKSRRKWSEVKSAASGRESAHMPGKEDRRLVLVDDPTPTVRQLERAIVDVTRSAYDLEQLVQRAPPGIIVEANVENGNATMAMAM